LLNSPSILDNVQIGTATASSATGFLKSIGTPEKSARDSIAKK
jgi:hypothetical protein